MEINVLYNGDYDHSFYEKFLLSYYSKVNMIKYKKNSLNTDRIDLLLFTGPSMFKSEDKTDDTGKDIELSRNVSEQKMFQEYRDIPKLGIDRGALLLASFNGSEILSNVNNHDCGIHKCSFTNDYIEKTFMSSNNTYLVKSNHTKMMYPYNLDKEKYDIILSSKYYLSDTYLNLYGEEEDIKSIDSFYEPEIIMFNKGKSLCIQGDLDEFRTNYNDLCYSLINRIINKK